jgi:hypothetical protein
MKKDLADADFLIAHSRDLADGMGALMSAEPGIDKVLFDDMVCGAFFLIAHALDTASEMVERSVMAADEADAAIAAPVPVAEGRCEMRYD